jgi:hypothetical protein
MKLLFIISLISIGLQASAAQLSDAAFLRKLSLSIKGVPPTSLEYQGLQSQPNAAAKKTYLTQKTQSYIRSAEHRDRLVFQLSEKLQMTPSGVPGDFLDRHPEAKESYEFKNAVKNDAMTDLFSRLTTLNLSWDSLLTEKSYTLYPRNENDYAASSDFAFFTFMNDKIPRDKLTGYAPDSLSRDEVTAPFPLAFPVDDPRIAGILTTKRFNARYNTTGINKNRRRAAAVFRTFLCDAMIPAINSNSDRTHDFNDVAFAQTYEVTEAQVKSGLAISANARHGSDAQCASCHYKLDPLGRAFQSMGAALMPDPSPGALVFKSAISGKLVDLPLRGLGDLGTAITSQPEYSDCQVSWFWQQYIGADVRLTTPRKAELTAAFDAVHRKTNDFIAYMVSQPEFRQRPLDTTQYVTFDRVQTLLKRCESCHSQEGGIADFSKLPFSVSGDPKEHKTWIADMEDRLGRPEGAKGRMPKDIDQWNPSDLDLIKSWLSQGARDENGKPTVGGGN